jgi:ubiquinone/menaquinone biosynthesis C-methylase UbiE
VQSISFDRAAGYYDQTRGLPAEIADQIAASAAEKLPIGARALEIGIGTGRISIPLMQRGLRISGIDLSVLMMKRLVEKVPHGNPPPALIQANATRLPLTSAAFDAVFAVHVFHLIGGWQQAVQEIHRVLRLEGLLFIGYSRRDPDSPLTRIREQWSKLIGGYRAEDPRPGVRDIEKLDAHLKSLGAEINTLDVTEWKKLTSPAETIQELEAGVHSNTWHLSVEALHSCGAQLRNWARDQYGDLEQPMKTSMRFTWKLAQWTL